MFKRLLLVGALVAGVWAADDVYDSNNWNGEISPAFCAGTITMGGNPKRKTDTMKVACIGDKLFSATENPAKVITPVANLGYPCMCNMFSTGASPVGIHIDMKRQWQEY
ncbi:MAG: hypothetical protein K2M73_08045 [Lachnospiraceae bacterium]|nr:hypothetical protein [Lachnospiraceae bacterium]